MVKQWSNNGQTSRGARVVKQLHGKFELPAQLKTRAEASGGAHHAAEEDEDGDGVDDAEPGDVATWRHIAYCMLYYTQPC